MTKRVAQFGILSPSVDMSLQGENRNRENEEQDDLIPDYGELDSIRFTPGAGWKVNASGEMG